MFQPSYHGWLVAYGVRMVMTNRPHESVGNTTTTPLGSSATFTGAGEQSELPDVGVSCQTDAAGTLFFDFSNDGTNWSPFPVSGFAVAADIHEFHTAVKLGRHFRARFVNGSTAQTYLRLHTYFGQYSKVPNAPLNQSIGPDSDAQLVRPAADFIFEVARGQVTGYDVVEKFGRNGDIDTTSDPEDVWAGGGLYTGQPDHADAAEALDIVSSDAADAAAGTGARTVRAHGLDANWEPQTVDATLNGTTQVSLSGTWRRLNVLEVLTGGSGGANAGTLTIDGATSGLIYAAVPPGFNRTQIAAYTVPDGFDGLLTHLEIAMARASGAAGSAQVTLRRRAEGGVYQVIRNYEITDGLGAPPIGAPLLLGAKDDIVVRVESVSDNNTIVTASFDVVLITV